MPFGPRDLVDLDTDLGCLKKVPGMAGYYINDKAEVFSVRKLHQFIDRDGYARVNSGRIRAAIHSLLAKVFLPKPRPGQNEVRHLDGNPSNNAIVNLAWGTRAENAQDLARHGTVKGSGNPRSILTESEVQEIHLLLNAGEITQLEIAKTFGVGRGTIKAIRNGQNWSHITKVNKKTA